MLGDRKEAVWYNTVKSTHGLFCQCGDPINHLLRIHGDWTRDYDEWLSGVGVGGGGVVLSGDEGTDDGGDAEHGAAATGTQRDDADMAAVAAATEEEDIRSE
nr:ORF2 [Epsilontorquevirus sp.]